MRENYCLGPARRPDVGGAAVIGLVILAQQLVNGLALGSVYALVAIGLSLIWATAKLLDFAFGEVFMLGGILTWTLAVGHGLPLLVSMALALAVCAGLGWLVERGALPPAVRRGPRHRPHRDHRRCR